MARTFYQNSAINPATMNFNFAHVYSNRYEMETKTVTDGIYPGRYVLIEYDKAFEAVIKNNDGTYDFSNSYSYKLAYSIVYVNNIPQNIRRVTYNNEDYTTEEGTYLTSVIEDESHVILYSDNAIYNEYDIPIGVTKGTVVSVKANDEYWFYIAKEGEIGEPVVFERIDLTSGDGVIYYQGQVINVNEIGQSEIYGYNYLIDKTQYPSMGRGYDSTVWQKTIVNGFPKYVQIAELNTVTPTFELKVDAPTEEGESPYFDEISSNVYYRLHTMPNWGFRVKEAEPNETNSSDPITYPSDKNGLAIYWNENGFKETKIGYDFAHQINDIKLEPTGISGREYYDKPNGDAEDIQELSIILPELGNTISNIWDIVYGDSDVNKAKWILNGGSEEEYDEELQRNRDIHWANANESPLQKNQGLRLVNDKYAIGEDETYEVIPNQYQERAVSTLAGCINSIHDIMGMIIYNGSGSSNTPVDFDDPNELEDASSDYIYYSGGSDYFRKGTETILDENYSPEDLYQPVNVIPYNSNEKYFYKDLTNFKRLILNNGEEPNDEIVYYKFEDEPNDMQLQEELYNWKNGQGYYYATDIPLGGLRSAANGESWSDTRSYFSLAFEPVNTAFYAPGIYYEKVNPNLPIGSNNKVLSYDVSPQADKIYYYEYEYSVYDEEIHNTKDITEYQGITAEELTLWQSGNHEYYYYKDGIYYPTSDAPFFYTVDQNNPPKEGQGVDLKLNFSRLINPNNLNKKIQFYQPNYYYYKFYIGNPEDDIYHYYKDSNGLKTVDRDYYLLKKVEGREIPVRVDKFYKPNKFYYESNGNYERDIDAYDSNKQYYERLELYVKQDLTNQYRIGSAWNQELGTDNSILGIYDNSNPPKLIDGIQLGVKRIIPKWYIMPEFARGLNTIHGMLLKLNALLNTDDVLTRNTETVQGCINKINDIIDLFGGLKPERFNIVNDKGKIVSADHAGDNWISVDIDGNARTVDITHKFTAITDTTSVNNLNGDNVSYVSADTIQLYTPKVDTKGHVVGKNTETTVLPFGFKTIATNGTDQSNPIIADSTQDTLNINSGNSWIQTATDTTNDILTISHETHTVTPNNSGTNTLSSTDSVPSFTISQYGYDNAGHIISETNTTISGAAGYGIVKGNTGTSTADVSLDTLNIIGDSNAVNNNTDQIKLISTSAGTDTLTITHETHTVIPNSNNTSTLSSTDSIPTFVINKYGYDNAGHIVSEINTTVSGVAGYGIIQGDNINQSTNEPITTTSTASLGKLIISGDNTWIKSKVTNQKVSLEHQGPETPSQHQATTSSPNFGDNLVLTNWYFDSKGHKNDNTNNTITFPSILFTENTQNINSNSAIVASLSLSNTDTTTEVTGKKINVLNKNVGSLTLTGYEDNLTIPQENRYITADSTIINAFRGTEQKLSDLKGSITGLNDDTISGTLANRIKAVETNTTDTTNSSTLISKIISLEQLTDNYGDIVSYDASAFDSAGTASTAASAVQGNTDSTVASVEASLINYLEINNAATTSFVLDDETDPNVPIEMTLQELYAYIKTLEDRIYDLEHPQSGDDPDPGNGGDDPTPPPSTPDVVVEFTEGTGSTTANFNDVLTNINNGDNDLTYSVIVDNTEIDLDETTPVEVEEDNGVYTVIINLDDSIYEKITWTNDGNNDTLTLIPIQNEP